MNDAWTQSLAGEWRFALDPNGVGVNFCGGWYALRLPETVHLPGDLSSNRKGIENHVEDWDSVGQPYAYVGPAWYQREITIPEDWADRSVLLHLPRTGRTRVWLDEVEVGACDATQTPQRYFLGAAAFPGQHQLTIRVDNVPIRPLNYARRCVNGILGDLRLEARDKVYISKVRVTPLPDLHRARVEVWLQNDSGLLAQGTLCLRARESRGRHHLPEKTVAFASEAGEKRVWLELDMETGFLLWDEFDPALYDMELALRAGNGLGQYADATCVRFGMRKINSVGRQLLCNGKAVFLRGDLASMAVRGYTGEDVDSLAFWRARMREYREYGVNHLRFHTHCPPEAALYAADEYGLYVQLELALGGVVAAPDAPDFEPLLEGALLRQGKAILTAYCNHPSFVMLTLGNEIEGDFHCLARVVAGLRAYDLSRLYAQGSNNNLNDPFYLEGDDFFVGNKTGPGHAMVRGSCAFADYPVGPVQGEDAPNTLRNHERSLTGYPLPVLSHELGQYETSLHPADVEQFPEGRKPRNLTRFARLMRERGLEGMAERFLRASGQLSALCYREDMEMAFRSEGMCGFQLLALNDALGQGSSLVGMRNALGKDKGIIAPERWREFCAAQVLLIGVEKFVYVSGETLRARLCLANFGPGDLTGAVAALRLTHRGQCVAQAQFAPQTAAQGQRHNFGEACLALPALTQAAQLELTACIQGTSIRSRLPLWVYPEGEPPQGEEAVVRRLDPAALSRLEAGEALLLIPERIDPGRSVEGHFASNFWSYAMFANMSFTRGVPVAPGTLGLCMDPAHPLFTAFPTQEGSSWQWWRIAMAARPLILDAFPQLEPLIYGIDNPMRGHKLGLVVEARVGKGRLLLCACDLLRLKSAHLEARAFYRALLGYLHSPSFAPKALLTPEEALRLLGDSR